MDTTLTDPAAPATEAHADRGPLRWVGRRPVIAVGLAFLLLRLVDLAFFAVVSRRDGSDVRTVLLWWDAGWYRLLAQQGYPADVATGDDGTLQESLWAWPPVYSWVVRAAATPWGDAGMEPAMLVVNLGSGLLATILLLWAFRAVLSTTKAVGIAVLWASLPAAPVFLMGYSEGLFCAFLFAATGLILRDRFVSGSLLLVLAGFTKVGVAPYTAALLVLLAVRVHRHGWQGQAPRLLLAGALSVVATVGWPAVVAWRLGSWAAYGQVQAAWERSTLPGADLLKWLYRLGTEGHSDGGLDIIALGVAVVAAYFVWKDHSYPLFIRLVGVFSALFTVFVVAGMSTVRLLLPDLAIPALLLRIASSWRAMVALSATLLVARYIWVAVYASPLMITTPP